jgi:hypothetical protein
MTRILIAGVAAAVSLSATYVMAASPPVESAIAALRAVAADPAKFKTYCAMTEASEALGEKEDAVAEAQIDGMAKQLGPDFEKAMEGVDDLEENSPDGRAYYAVVDEIEAKCP